jgi:formamidopyrimidine-DNA glycosylase
MPELPEVETIRRDVAEAVLGRRTTVISLHLPVAVQHPAPELFVAGLTGRTVVSAERVGKYLLLGLDNGRYWVIHLSLEGRLLFQEEGTHLTQGTLLVVSLDDGHQLVLRDHVSYSKTYLLDREDIGSVLHLHEYGPEPIMPGFSEGLLRERMAGRRGMIKPLLLNQRILAGVGNIYADEALFRACIHPERRVTTLTDTEWTALHAALVGVLHEGIADRGTTAPGGLYRDLFGRKGRHQEHLAVFRKAGEHCPECRAAIRTSTVSGRPTFYCPNCQRT